MVKFKNRWAIMSNRVVFMFDISDRLFGAFAGIYWRKSFSMPYLATRQRILRRRTFFIRSGMRFVQFMEIMELELASSHYKVSTVKPPPSPPLRYMFTLTGRQIFPKLVLLSFSQPSKIPKAT